MDWPRNGFPPAAVGATHRPLAPSSRFADAEEAIRRVVDRNTELKQRAVTGEVGIVRPVVHRQIRVLLDGVALAGESLEAEAEVASRQQRGTDKDRRNRSWRQQNPEDGAARKGTSAASCSVKIAVAGLHQTLGLSSII